MAAALLAFMVHSTFAKRALLSALFPLGLFLASSGCGDIEEGDGNRYPDGLEFYGSSFSGGIPPQGLEPMATGSEMLVSFRDPASQSAIPRPWTVRVPESLMVISEEESAVRVKASQTGEHRLEILGMQQGEESLIDDVMLRVSDAAQISVHAAELEVSGQVGELPIRPLALSSRTGPTVLQFTPRAADETPLIAEGMKVRWNGIELPTQNAWDRFGVSPGNVTSIELAVSAGNLQRTITIPVVNGIDSFERSPLPTQMVPSSSHKVCFQAVRTGHRVIGGTWSFYFVRAPAQDPATGFKVEFIDATGCGLVVVDPNPTRGDLYMVARYNSSTMVVHSFAVAP